MNTIESFLLASLSLDGSEEKFSASLQEFLKKWLNEIETRYSEQQRAYHTLEHILSM